MCEETFRAKFHLPLHSFIERLLARYGLVPTYLHLNAWRGIIHFMVKCVEVGLEPKIRELRLVLFLKANLISKSIVYTNYKSTGLAPLVYESLHK